MSLDAIRRVPISDWLMGLTVLMCGVVAVVAAWRYADRLAGAGATSDGGRDEGEGGTDLDPPAALPPGPSNRVVLPDRIDQELWSIIDAERRRLTEATEVDPPERIAARALPTSPTREEP